MLIGLTVVIISLYKCILIMYNLNIYNFYLKIKTNRYPPSQKEHFFSAFWGSDLEWRGVLWEVIRTLVFLSTMQTTAECLALILVSRIWSQSHFPCDGETAFIHFSKSNTILLNSFISNNIVSYGIIATSESNWLSIVGNLPGSKSASPCTFYSMST